MIKYVLSHWLYILLGVTLGYLTARLTRKR